MSAARTMITICAVSLSILILTGQTALLYQFSLSLDLCCFRFTLLHILKVVIKISTLPAFSVKLLFIDGC